MDVDLKGLADHFEAIAEDCDGLANEAYRVAGAMQARAASAHRRVDALRALIDGSESDG